MIRRALMRNRRREQTGREVPVVVASMATTESEVEEHNRASI
jgi:hypothetical protein